jgi:hypothetical protein
MATEIEAAKLLTLRAAAMKDAGMKTTLESSMAKLYASEVAVKCANEGVQIHGGYGFIKDYPAEKFYRDVKLCTIGEGTSEIQRLVIARQLLKDYVCAPATPAPSPAPSPRSRTAPPAGPTCSRRSFRTPARRESSD